MVQFSFNPGAAPFAPGQDVEHKNGSKQDKGTQQHSDNPAANASAFPGIEGTGGLESLPKPITSPPGRGTFKSLLTEALAISGQEGSAASQNTTSSSAARTSQGVPSSPAGLEWKPQELPVVSERDSPSAPSDETEGEQKMEGEESTETTHPESTPEHHSTESEAKCVSTTEGIVVRAACPSAGVHKGSYRGSPVVDVRLATEVNHTTVSALRSIGPSDFQAVREIGQGAFGKVYLVQSRTTRQRYAMKVLNKQRVIQKEQVAYAMGERNVMSSLSHPYLVNLRFAFQTNHRLFLVMDYIEGGHLWTQMKSGFLDEPVAKIFTAEIVLALIHLHSLGIAHRDLKPENILLDSDNHLRITDFGLAKKDLAEDGRANTMVGTVDYMAPEIIKGEGHGREVDWWSLGVLLYEMLCARLPFVPPTQRPAKGKKGKDGKMGPGTDEYKAEVKKRILNGKVQWPKGKFVAVLSPAAKNLIQRLLAKSPDQRLTGEAVMQHEWFKGIDWGKLERREIPSPLRSSIFAGAPDQISMKGLDIDMAPLEAPCPRLAGYLFECDTPKGSPDATLTDNFAGFTYVPESELARAANSQPAYQGTSSGKMGSSGALIEAF